MSVVQSLARFAHIKECLFLKDLSELQTSINQCTNSVLETIVLDIRIQTGKGELQEPFPTHMMRDSPCSV